MMTNLRCFLLLSVLLPSFLVAQNRVKVTSEDARIFLDRFSESAFTKAGLQVESFEGSFLPDGWSKITIDGNDQLPGWQKVLVGEQIFGFENPGLAPDTPSGGGNAMAFASWATGDSDGDFATGDSTDQYLITPLIENVMAEDSLVFYLQYFAEFGDNLDILISTTNTASVESFNVIVDELRFSGLSTEGWERFEYRLTDFVSAGSNIYVAFREHVLDTEIEGDALLLDLVEVTSLISSIEDRNAGLPKVFSLAQNYPNPFNPTTTIKFSLPKTTEVRLKVFNLLGFEVANLVNGRVQSGSHLIEFDASDLVSGVYFYRLEAGSFVQTKRLLLLK